MNSSAVDIARSNTIRKPLVCQHCKKPIKVLSRATLFVNMQQVAQREEQYAAWTRSTSGNLLISARELCDMPEPTRWRVWCDVCYLPDESNTYGISLDRIHTVDEALVWTLHLLEKNWFAQTDWNSAIAYLFPKLSWGC